MMSFKLPFNTGVALVEHDPSLVRRYFLQTLLRHALAAVLVCGLCVTLPVAHAWWSQGYMPDSVNWLYLLPLFDFIFVFPALIAMACSYLGTLREAGTSLTPEMISSRPGMTVSEAFTRQFRQM